MAAANNMKNSDLNRLSINSSFFIDMSTVRIPAASINILKNEAKSSVRTIPSKRMVGEVEAQPTIVYASEAINNSRVSQETRLVRLARENKLAKINNRIPVPRITSGITNPKLLVIDSSLMLIPFSNVYGVCRERAACKTDSAKC